MFFWYDYLLAVVWFIVNFFFISANFCNLLTDKSRFTTMNNITNRPDPNAAFPNPKTPSTKVLSEHLFKGNLLTELKNLDNFSEYTTTPATSTARPARRISPWKPTIATRSSPAW